MNNKTRVVLFALVAVLIITVAISCAPRSGLDIQSQIDTASFIQKYYDEKENVVCYYIYSTSEAVAISCLPIQ
jgi:hypothetical protein